jgi:hypothetical protein
LSESATLAKRAEIAAQVRASAEGLQGYARMIRLLEAYVYDNDPVLWRECDAAVLAYVQQLQALSVDALTPQRSAVVKANQALSYLQRFAMIPADYVPAEQLQQVVDQQGWGKRR